MTNLTASFIALIGMLNILLIFAIVRLRQTVDERYEKSDQVTNHDRAESFHDQCPDGANLALFLITWQELLRYMELENRPVTHAENSLKGERWVV